ncbi:MAG: S8 family serine peptidase [Euryarchaeota archaeon]|nr:S8 family serine peptidase [Euryarchaeota archaeon]
MRKIVLMMIAVMMLSVASMGAVGTSDKTADAAKEKEQVITGDEASELVIIGFKERLNKAAREQMVEEHSGKVSHSYRIINAVASRIPSKDIDKLKKNPNVKYVEPDYIFNATAQQLPWGVERIGAPIVHGYNRGSGVKVAILDSGIDYNHPDLYGNYVGGIDFVNGDDDPMDDYGHGTHCAGIVAAMDNEIGVIGVAPEASLYGVKVLNNRGNGQTSDIIAGIEWSVNNDMQVLSMSLGGWQYSSALHEACDAASNSGVLLVAAAGNRGSNWMPSGNVDIVDYPARYESVIAVAATDSMDERPYWSSTGASVELAAPGVDINSTYWDDTYTTKLGTSMACPHVGGTAALILVTPEDTARDANNDGTYETNGDGVWTNNEVRAILQATANDLGDPGRDNLYGFGLVNASKAVPPSGDDIIGPMTSGISAEPNPTNGADSVTLTASISDSTTGNSDIATAEYFIDTVGADGTGTSMNPSDGSFNSATEDVTADIDVSGWAAGSYTLYVHGNDSADNWGATASLALEVTAEDATSPITSDVSADPNPTNGADSVTLTASISDSTTGNSDIATAEYFIDTVGADGTGTSMNPSDGSFNSATEDVTADIDVSGWAAGSYTLYVHGTDSADNWGATEQVILEVATDDTGPITSDVSADPNPTNGADSVTLTASISDFTTGNSNIATAEYFIDTVGADGTGTSMNPSDGSFNSATEDVTADIDVSGWAADSYTLYVHGNDSAGNWGATASLALEVIEAATNTMMHVDSIDMELIHTGVFYHATATATIVDATNNPVDGVTVSGHWEGATNDQDSGVTDSEGQTPSLRSDYRWAPSGTTFTFVVDNATKDGWTYDPDANEETEDSVTVP